MLKKILSIKNQTDPCVVPNVNGCVALKLNNIYKKFPTSNKYIINNINITVNTGEIFTILGETGSGKTTLLRMIAGFESPNSGELIINHQYAYKDGLVLKPEQRGVGIMFQHCALFPHMNVLKNIEFAVSSKSKVEKQNTIDKIISMLHLESIAYNYPYQLSGGQQQKVAIARILALNPKIILFDEAFSNLDKNLRLSVRDEIKDLIKKNNITAIFVTHDQEEAFAISDRIAILENGNLLQVDTPQNIYQHPTNSYVAQFVGKANILNFIIEQNTMKFAFGNLKIGEHPIETIPTNVSNQSLSSLMIRPENIIVNKQFHNNSFKATVQKSTFYGMYTELNLNLHTTHLNTAVIGESDLKETDSVYVSFKKFDFV